MLTVKIKQNNLVSNSKGSNKIMTKYKYIVWVGGVDDYYENYEDAKRDYNEWKEKGYDDVQIEELE
jgi:hypothetical protein